MSFVGATDVPIEIIGGLVCDMAASELPAGVSPDCKDVVFSESSVRTRPGLGTPYLTLAGATVNYLKTFVESTGTLRCLLLDSAANLYQETAPGVATLIEQIPDVNVAAPYGNSTTLFAKEWLAPSDGKFGVGIPRQFDGTRLDRVTQCGPGQAPSVTDVTIATSIVASPAGATQPATVNLLAAPNGARLAVGSFQIVVGTAAPHGLVNGQGVVLAGVTDARFNGTYTNIIVVSPTIFSIPTSLNFFSTSGGGTMQSTLATYTTTTASGAMAGLSVTTAGVGVGGYNVTAPIFSVQSPTVFQIDIGIAGSAASGGGTVTIAGNISAGVHQVSVLFVTEQGFLTSPAPFAMWTAGGGNAAAVLNIPIGPSNIIQRILVFTAAGGSSFFYLTGIDATLVRSNMVINDNVTTSAVVNFTDPILLAGTSVDYLFNQVELGECAGVIDYSERVFWWGERNKVPNFNNLTFDGGFSNLTSATTGTLPNFPLGWTQDPVFAAGGASAVVSATSALFGGLPAIWGDAYAIFGNGATATRGLITQSAVVDFRGVAILQVNTGYSVRFRARWAYTAVGSPTAGNLVVEIYSPSQGSLGLASVAYNTLTNTYAEYNLPLMNAVATVPADAQLRIYANGTPDQKTVFLIDNLEPYPTNQPNNRTSVRASRAFNPESFDGVTGLLNVNEDDGWAVRSAFKLRGDLFVVKEHSLHGTADDGSNEPSGWSLREISARVGTPSVRGVGVGEDWVVIADRSGLYIFWGTEPQKISQEIGHSNNNFTLAWDQINWQYGHTLWVTVDTQEKRILVGAPFNGATSPNAILQLDYRDVDPEEGSTGAQAIAASPSISISFGGKKIIKDKSRKWSPWTPSINSCAMIERTDGTSHLWLGAGTGVPDAGAVYDVQRTNLTDYSTAATIPSYYTTAFIPDRATNQVAQTHEHRKHFNYLTLFVEGKGFVNLSASPNQFGTFLQQNLPSLVLTSPAYGDLECPISVDGERISFRISQSGAASWFRLQKFTPSMMGSPTAPVRGSN